jgi:ABC-type glycerol-3-phosphate transport system substrate-binding protein
MFVNKDLLKKATGNDRMPRTFDEWIEDCRQLQEYGKTTSQPIISIGVRGLDKATLDTLFKQYFSQLNGNLCDEPSLFGSSKPGTPELLSWIAQGKIDRKRMFEAVDLTCELGRYFCEGFSSIDLEQTKFLFFSGNVGFFPEGTWNAWSMVNNSPFEVGVINIPVIGPGNRYFSDFTGRTSELGVDIGGRFGITKASKNPDLALDFLRFLKSYRINQLTMMDYCKWPPAVIKAEYKGLLEKFKPEEGDARLPLNPPFFIDKKSETKMLESLERIIVNHYPEPGKYFWSQFIDNMPYMISEASEAENSSERQFFELSAQCDGATVGLLDQAIDKESCRIRERGLQMDLENLVDRIRQRYLLKRGLDAMKELSARPEKQVK